MIVKIDFATRRQFNRAQLMVIVMLVAGIASASGLAVLRMRTLAQLDADRASLASARGLATVLTSTHASVPAAQLLAINTAINSLNTPWTKILGGIELSKPSTVAILELESLPMQHRVRIVAEAEDANDLFDFVDAIQQQTPFRHVTPISQDHVEISPGSGISRTRLSFEVEWRW